MQSNGYGHVARRGGKKELGAPGSSDAWRTKANGGRRGGSRETAVEESKKETAGGLSR